MGNIKDKILYHWYKIKYKNSNRGNSESFKFKRNIKFCKVVDIIDGQTLVIIMDFKNKSYKWHLRLDKYNTYIISKNKIDNKSTIYLNAIKIYEYLEYLINLEPYRIFKLKINGYNKKGLILGDLYYIDNNISINKLMIKNSLCIETDNLSSYLHQ
jgi:hypothetical protein